MTPKSVPDLAPIQCNFRDVGVGQPFEAAERGRFSMPGAGLSSSNATRVLAALNNQFSIREKVIEN
jgi:hypothetical protein